MDQNQKQQAVEQLRNATTILVTTSSSPSVDQIAASLGIAKMLQKMDKSVTTVITSPLPGSIKFLNAEKELSDNLDSLRDFIVSLDKDLADKLRYKVEGDEVRIFITPYRSQIKKDDIRFSQGDFNIDAVVVVGTVNRTDVDAAVAAQSRVLNETPVVSISAGATPSSVGGINWHDPQASSVSEMIVSVSEALQPGLLDNISSNILLTGIISATDHFSNPATSPKVMTMAAQLMAAGADQQTIIRELKGTSVDSSNKQSLAKQDDSNETIALEEDSDKDSDSKASNSDNDIKISHNDEVTKPEPAQPAVEPKVTPEPAAPLVPEIEKPTETPEPAIVEPTAPDTLAVPAPPVLAPEPVIPAPVAAEPLDEARAAVEAAVAAQPVGTPLNPVADLGAQDLTSGVDLDNSAPVVAPQLGDLPAAPSVDDSSSNTSAVAGSVNPSQLYPEVPSQQ